MISMASALNSTVAEASEDGLVRTARIQESVVDCKTTLQHRYRSSDIVEETDVLSLHLVNRPLVGLVRFLMIKRTT